MEDKGSIDWCDINTAVTNRTNSTGSGSFCAKIETFTIYQHIRLVDVIILTLNVAFLLFLFVKFVPTMKKLKRAWPLFSILYSQVLLIPILCCTHEVISMVFDHHYPAAKVTHYMLRGAILTTEISVVVFGLSFKYYRGQRAKLVLTMSAIILFSVAYTVLEGILDMVWKRHIVCDKQNLFTHGGMIFLFITSALLSVAYMITFLLYLFNLHIRWGLPSKKSFYRYALFLSVVNIAQAIGSMLWFNGLHHKNLGNAGICITMVTTDIYLITFSPVVYWIFLRNYFRMNTTASEPPSFNNNISHIRTNSSPPADSRSGSPPKKWWRVSLANLKHSGSKPMPIYKQILNDESTHLLRNESMASEVGSYMSALSSSSYDT